MRAYINLARFRFECSFYTWIYRIVTNLCLDHLRKKSSRGRDLNTTMSPDGEPEDMLDRMPDHSPSASPERSFAGRECSSASSAPWAGSRLANGWSSAQALPRHEVAHGRRNVNTTEGTIKNTLFRATHKLRTQLAEVR